MSQNQTPRNLKLKLTVEDQQKDSFVELEPGVQAQRVTITNDELINYVKNQELILDSILKQLKIINAQLETITDEVNLFF